MKRVAILYGSAEGPALTWRLRPVLRAHGYELTHDVTDADCIITHSGGVLELPTDLPGALVLIVVPSTGYAGSLVNAAIHKIILDIKNAWRQHAMVFWLHKSLINAWYAANIMRLYSLYKKNKQLGHALPPCNAAKVVVIVQPHDPWSRDLPTETVQKNQAYAYLTIPGQHDDIWAHPDIYTSLLITFDN
jgi:hypothetical protein